MTKQTFVSKVVSLLFNMVFRLVTPGDLPDPGIEPRSPALQADALTSEPPGKQEYWSGLPFPSPESESEVAQSYPTLRDPVDCTPPGSSVHEIFQARILEWFAISFSKWVFD